MLSGAFRCRCGALMELSGESPVVAIAYHPPTLTIHLDGKFLHSCDDPETVEQRSA